MATFMQLKSDLSMCSLCRNVAVAEFRPFCSRGCRDRDLLKWLDGKYSVPVADDEDMDDSLDKQPPPAL